MLQSALYNLEHVAQPLSLIMITTGFVLRVLAFLVLTLTQAGDWTG
jgi:hypothetical protein